MSEYIIEMNNIQKRFGLVHAIRNGFFNLKPGEVHSLIGENGAGKSTMMKLLYGMYDFDAGEIKVKGQPVAKLTPKEAIAMGIGMVHQEFMLVNELTVLENIILGFEPRKGSSIDKQLAQQQIQKYIDDYHLDVQLDKKVQTISTGEAQRVEIIKTLYRGADILILDEPTAVLTPQETLKLFEIIEELKRDHKSIIFISHKLNEVMQISDRISVMRQGEYIDTVAKSETNTTELARLMVGRDVLLDVSRAETTIGQEVLKVDELWTSGVREASKIRGLSLSVHSGEVVGIAGIDGNGQSELIEAITGMRLVEKGKVYLQGEDVTNKTPAQIREAGLAHIPEDRNVRGLNREGSIEDNLVALDFAKNYSTAFLLNRKKINNHAKAQIAKYDIRPTDPKLKTKAMSGGNAQKVVVAREVEQHKPLLIACQPTRGVDIGAIESIREHLNTAKRAGMGILLVSAELEEILSLSDRIVVMYEGAISGEVSSKEANREKIGLLMMGGKQAHA